MRRININRKTLSIILCFALVSIFSLTIAYAALSVTLNIVGSAEVVASNWDIHLANPKVKNGSVTTAVPSVNGNTLTFNTVLKNPGDYYEFTVDVVNNGTIDAIIDSVTKSPNLTTEQLKYLKYEVSYQNGESITSGQLIEKNTTMPIKVRIEYRKDLVASDLPTSNSNLSLSLTLHYVQSDGSGILVDNNGSSSIATISGSLDNIGTIVKIGSEYFYVYGYEGNNVKLLSMYNLYIGNVVNQNTYIPTPLTSPTGMQDSTAKGWVDGASSFIGTINFASEEQHGAIYSDYIGSVAEIHVNNYKTEIEKMGIDVRSARLITMDELMASPYNCSKLNWDCLSSSYSWIYSTSYWTMTAYDDNVSIYTIFSDGNMTCNSYPNDFEAGIRPVLIISRDQLLGNEPTMISFSIDNVTYQAEEGMTWEEWAESDYNTGGFFISNYCLYSKSSNIVCNQYSSTSITNTQNYFSTGSCN